MKVHSSMCCPQGVTVSVVWCTELKGYRVEMQPFTDPMLWFDDIDGAEQLVADTLPSALMLAGRLLDHARDHLAAAARRT